MAEFIVKHCADADKDLKELWQRIVFSICVKNTDDHLRNHGFLLTKQGWALSPAFDINPNEYGTGLSLNISGGDNSLDTALALEVAGYFRIDNAAAKRIIKKTKDVVATWQTIAAKYKIAKHQQEKMAAAFI